MLEPANPSEINTESPPEVVIDVQAEPQAEPAQRVPEMGVIEDFKYAPPKPDGDPWEILWKARMVNEKLQCDAWKDEVQNLLIFAGLFSAVVTAFIVESYKTLQPDPNDAIISLLSHIATRLDGASSNSTSAVVSSMPQSFSPTPSSVRVNIFWFISLVLSLTTVLVDIIGLQWLREYLSYSGDLKPRKKYALCLMRADGLEAWHVDKIFTSLPPLLQSALVLFLGGVIDFLHAIGHRTVVIPVTVVVGVTLIFLVATTILPWLQVYWLYFVSFKKVFSSNDVTTTLPYHIHEMVPTPYPYKSPQSLIVWRLWSALQWTFRDMGDYFPFSMLSWPHPKRDTPKAHFIRYLSPRLWWGQQTWVEFDFSWLSIRDGYMRSLYRRSSSKDVWWNGNWTFFDLLRGLLYDRYYEPHFPSSYHCFSELSQLALQPMGFGDEFTNLADLCRQSAYLHDIVGSDGNMLLPNFLMLQSRSDETPGSDFSEIAKIHTAPLPQQNMEAFIPVGWQWQKAASCNSMLKVHLLKYSLQAKNSTPSAHFQLTVPKCLVLHRHQLDQNAKDFPVATPQALVEDIVDTTQIILQTISSESVVYNTIFQRDIFRNLLISSGFCAGESLESQDCLHSIKNKYHSTFDFINEHLTRDMELWITTPCFPSLLFYMSSVFARSVVVNHRRFQDRPPHWVSTDIPFRSSSPPPVLSIFTSCTAST